MTVNSKYSEDLREKDNQKMGSKRPLYRKKNQLLGLERDKNWLKHLKSFRKAMRKRIFL
jgi:hypothetical protein